MANWKGGATVGRKFHANYNRWGAMKDRCDNPNNPSYHRYGGRGIRVCERWYDFWNFQHDVGFPPFEGASLDRIDNDGHYEPGNVRWATAKEQRANQDKDCVPGKLGWVTPEETKRKIGEANKGRYKGVPQSEEMKKKRSEGMKGHSVSEETRAKIAASLSGRKRGPHSEETRRKMSEAHSGKPKSEEHKRKLSAAKKKATARK